MRRNARGARARTTAAIATLAIASLLVAACGQKGPLYLPDAGKQSVPQADAPAPAADSKDTDKKKSGQPPAR
jgi:predicted small lipoprotein YifL